MSRSEPVELTVMCMLRDGQGRLLMQQQKPSWPGLAFPGGHVEPGESFTGAVIREMREETGLTILDPQLCGVKQFQTGEGVRYVVLFYRVSRFTGTLTPSAEGEVFWLPRDELARYPLAEDFLDMLRVFESDLLNEFYYHNGQYQLL